MFINAAKFFKPTRNTQTRGHSKRLEKPRVNTSLRMRSFSMRIINEWNSLPEEVVTAPSVNTFKNRLDNHWASRAIAHEV